MWSASAAQELSRSYGGSNTFEVFGGIHACGGVIRLDDADANAMGQRAQLLERLDDFEWSSGQSG